MTTLGVVSHLHFQTLSCVVLRTVQHNQTGLDITGYDWIDTVTFVRGPRILSFAKKTATFSGIILRKYGWSECPSNDYIFLLKNKIGDLVAATRPRNRIFSTFWKIVNHAKRTLCICLLFRYFSAPCSPPVAPVDGFVFGDNHQHHSSVQFWCKQGFTLRGSANSQCVDGKWDSPIPFCEGELLIVSVTYYVPF